MCLRNTSGTVIRDLDGPFSDKKCTRYALKNDGVCLFYDPVFARDALNSLECTSASLPRFISPTYIFLGAWLIYA